MRYRSPARAAWLLAIPAAAAFLVGLAAVPARADLRVAVGRTRDGQRFSLTVAVPARTTAFIDLPGGHHATLAGGPHGTERTFAG